MRICWCGFYIIVVCVVGCQMDHPIALGTLERERIVHNATAALIITEQPVAESQAVKKGDLLVQLDDRQQQANLLLAEAQLSKANARWDELHSGARIEDIEAARADLAGAEASQSVAQKSFDRRKKLRQDGLISQADYDQALALLEGAKAKVRAAEEKLLMLTNGVRVEVLRQAEADVQIARAQLEVANIQLQDLQVRATRDGLLDSLPWNVGERVNVGTPVAIVLADSAPYARVYVPETRRAQLQIGQPLSVRLDGYPDELHGKLRWVAKDPAFTPYFALNQEDRARLVYLAEIDLDGAEPLPTGMPVQVYLNDQKP